MEKIILYAIKDRGTGKFLPRKPGKSRGFTADEPGDGHMPRLFSTAGGARRALSWWRKGRTYTHGYVGSDDRHWATRAKPERALMDMQVVPMTLTEA